MIKTFSGLGTYMKKQTESIKSKNPRHLGCISTSIHLNESSLKQKKPSPSFSKTSTRRGRYIKCNYCHIFLVHTLKENKIYDHQFHLEDQYFFVYRLFAYHTMSMNRYISFCSIFQNVYRTKKQFNFTFAFFLLSAVFPN